MIFVFIYIYGSKYIFFNCVVFKNLFKMIHILNSKMLEYGAQK